MKPTAFLLLALIMFTCSYAQDKIIKDANAEARSVTAFHGVQVSQGIQLLMKQGDADGVAVSAASEEYRNHIRTEVHDGILKIYYDVISKANWHMSTKKLKAYVSFKQLDFLTCTSGASALVDGNMNAGDLKIQISSGANFKGAVNASDLNIDGGSGATAELSGKVSNLSIDLSSGAGVYGYGLVTEKCKAGAHSGANVEVNVNKELAAQASSGGGIRYKGNCVLTKISTGSGGVIRKG